MLIPIRWLRDYVSFDLALPELAERLTMAGLEVEEIRETPDDAVLDIYVTPNRGDCLSLVGVARETAALLQVSWQGPAAEVTAEGPPEPGLTVTIDAPDLCPRYAARVIRGIRVGPSPEWLQARLRAAGLRPISNVVDVTNYVMLELGQPLHAFDLATLREGRIVVRRARAGESITTIDGTEVALEPEMLVIADAERPVAIAGVMGGLETEVTAGTTDLLLESAHFSPASVRRTAKRIPLSTPASYRFERSVDPQGVLRALDRAAQLIAEIAGGRISQTQVDEYPRKIEPAVIQFRPEQCNRLLGQAIPTEDMRRYFEQLGLSVDAAKPESWSITVPTYRPDLTLEADLIEEIARLYGYQSLPETLPSGAPGVGSVSEIGQIARRLREQLLAQGLNDAVTNTLTSLTWLERCRLTHSPAWPSTDDAQHASDGTSHVVMLRNPLSEEWSALRPSLLPGLLQSLDFNIRRGQENVFLGEVGWVHSRSSRSGEPQDRLLVAGVMRGSRWMNGWNLPQSALTTDFYATRGVVEAIAADLRLPPLSWSRSQHPFLHPGRGTAVSLAELCLGALGQIHPVVAAELDVPGDTFVFELDAQTLMEASTKEHRYVPPSRFPTLSRDLNVVVARDMPAASVAAVIARAGGELARSVRLFDVYRGGTLPQDRVSLAFSLELSAPDRTLTDAEADELLTRVRTALRNECGGDFR